jgi:hypothetical protein
MLMSAKIHEHAEVGERFDLRIYQVSAALELGEEENETAF